MDTEIIFTVEDSADGGFEARALGHSIFTDGATVEELREMVRDAVRCHFDDDERPKPLAERRAVKRGPDRAWLLDSS